MKIIRYKNEMDFSYALGATLVFELLQNKPELTRRVFVSSQANDSPVLNEIFSICSARGIEVIKGDKAFNLLSPKENCFVIAEFEKFHATLDSSTSNIVLVNPSDAGNVGTIVRTAVGLGFSDIAVIRPAVDIFNPKAIRASMGAVFHARIEYFDSIAEYKARFSGHNLYAFMLKGAEDFSATEVKQPFAFIFGNEATGLPDEYANFCRTVKIPQTVDIDSFSLPIAAAIAMYSAKHIQSH